MNCSLSKLRSCIATLHLNIKRENMLANFLNKYYGTDNVKIETFILYVSDNLRKEFLNNYIKNKYNFLVTHIDNNSISNARNLGTSISNSKYIAFVDTDDNVEKDFLKEAYEIIDNKVLDIIIGGYNEIRNGNIDRVTLSESRLHIYKGDNKDTLFIIDYTNIVKK